MPDTPDKPGQPKTNYGGNARKQREGGPKEPQKLDKVVVGQVVKKQESFGTKARKAIIATDVKTFGDYIVWDVVVPWIRDGIFDLVVKGARKGLYDSRTSRTRENILRGNEGHSTVTRYPYNQHSNPMNTRTSEISRRTEARSDRFGYILSDRQEANDVLDRLSDVMQIQGFATVANLKEALGQEHDITPVDYNYGWKTMANVTNGAERDGWVINFPAPVVVQHN